MQTDLLHRLAAGCVILTPNRRLALYLKHQFDAAQTVAGRSVWRSADVLPWGAWLERTYGELTRCRNDATLLSPLQERALWQRIIEASPHANALLDPGAAARAARDAWTVQHAWRIDVAAQRLHHDADVAAWFEWSQHFHQVCDDNRWLDGGRLADAVAALLRQAPGRAPRDVVFYGFDQLSLQQREVLDALAATGTRIDECAPAGCAAATVRAGHDTAEDELAAVAHDVRRILEAKPDTRIGVVIPDLAAKRDLVMRMFDDVLEPARALSGGSGRPRPYNVSLGKALADYPLVHTALLLLRLAHHPLTLAEMGSVLRSPFLAAAETEMTGRALLDARLRRRSGLTVNAELLRRYARGTGDGSENCAVLSRRLDTWRRLTDGIGHRRQPPSAWSETFLSLLAALGWPGERGQDSTEHQTVEKWRETVTGLSALDAIFPMLGFGDALSWLRRASNETLFQPESPDGPVQILGMLEAVGLEFDNLFVTGLCDDAWPGSPRPNPFLPIALQRACAVPHASAEWELGFAQRMLALWSRAAPQVRFSYPLRDGDVERRPSPLLASIAEAPPAIAVEPYRTRIYAASAIERLPDAAAPALAPGAPAYGGAALFSDQAACPFRAFAIHRLGASALESGCSGLDARNRGSLVHQALACLWREIGSHARLLELDVDEAGAAIAGAVGTAIADLRRKRPEVLTDGFAQLEHDRISALLTRLLELERRRAPFEVLACEEPRSLQIGGIAVDVRIDRIDRLSDGAHVILDYKTGAVSAGAWDGERPDEPQLPLYAVTDDGDVDALSFVRLSAQEVAFKGASRTAELLPGVAPGADDDAGWNALFDSWRSVLERLAAGFLAGDARVAPKHYPQTCRYCDVGPLCRVTELFDRGPVAAENDDE
ncbi:MAG TPA: PD-(D/E)XK nuclease family protein [Burkholderiales bacterium]|nr:PD-(D/E)XK nuclease family protein [Burkholderiales bacterium]